MKTLEQVIEMHESKTLDGRDLSRLAMFVPEESLHLIGVFLKEEYKGAHEHIAFTKENVLKQLEEDVSFAFEKALNQRGLSAGLMFDVVMMWNWILEDGLENWNTNEYAQYGLPLFKATAIKYGFDNPIGEDTGSESKFAC
ncbi:hypothetical protein [Bacillus tropicus]|uniref:hypothetical protein n=1 Tax=Bacillus tropicus TaxID=2026188 RepID=UPI0021D0A57B|nr:hypothetical protein [Bacillus tropicus]MCU5224000.1 hypothetical protein [Bacillus tropicus]